MLLYTGDSEDQRVAEMIYRELLRERPDDAASNYRLSGILREKGEFTEALERLARALDMVERGEDGVITTDHWIYDEIRRVFGTTYWRMSQAEGIDKQKQRELLAKAIEHSYDVVRKPADPDFRLSAINDSLYYNWEFLNLAEGEQSLIEEQELEELRNLLYDHYQNEKANSDNLGWHWLDTLARLFSDDRAKVKEVALHFEQVIEQRVRIIKPALQLASRGSRQWNAQLSQILTKDEVDSLVFCQEILDEIGR
ncbi:hypothetical protein AJ87_14900 [Rhizobium yanglingense]|nr:hypothetical protein AJ87_14900 [Rhizobium yanglingense]